MIEFHKQTKSKNKNTNDARNKCEQIVLRNNKRPEYITLT